MKEGPIRVLLLEDDEADAEIVVTALRIAGITATTERVQTEGAFISALKRFRPDVVLAEHVAFGAPAALAVVRAHRPGTPFIVVSGALREDLAVTCLRAGAENLVSKQNLGRLGPAIEEALRWRAPLERLSGRQRDVLRLVAEGRSTPAIARELQLSVKTVETHRAAVMRRLNIHDRVGLVRYAVRVGLVPLEPEPVADAGDERAQDSPDT